MSLILATLSSQPLLLPLSKSSLVSRIFAARTSVSSRFKKTSYHTIQPLDWCSGRSLKTIGQRYRSCPVESHSISHQQKRSVAASHLSYIRKFTPHLTANENLKSHQVANMSTRRSARLIAAAELEISSSVSSTVAAQPASVPAQKGRKRKARAEEAPDGTADEAPTKPAKKAKAAKTPRTSKATKASNKEGELRASTPPPPPTPTLDSAKLAGEPAAAGDAIPVTPLSKKPRAAAVDRLADSNTTLATLLSPETSRVVTKVRTRRSPSASPTKKKKQEKQEEKSAPDASASAPKAAAAAVTAADILEEGNRFLISVDPRMRPLVENNHCRIFSPEGLAEEVDPFEALCSGIISQQVSGAAAKSIKKRFIDLFYEGEENPDAEAAESGGSQHPNEEGAPQERRFPHPSQVVKKSLETLRTAGLSQRKAEYVSGLAEKFVGGELSAQLLADAPYEEVISRLTAVRGLGLWSAEMFACFALKRIDVFSLGDLGVQRGMAAFVGKDIAKLKSKGGGKFKYMSEADMQALSDQFKPYRSLFMWYMWRVEETDISTME
ncbi:DNA glycosylase [Nemania sp. NC0429]|nr:DNA glycosylase [Nemania sp. NC0429]